MRNIVDQQSYCNSIEGTSSFVIELYNSNAFCNPFYHCTLLCPPQKRKKNIKKAHNKVADCRVNTSATKNRILSSFLLRDVNNSMTRENLKIHSIHFTLSCSGK